MNRCHFFSQPRRFARSLHPLLAIASLSLFTLLPSGIVHKSLSRSLSIDLPAVAQTAVTSPQEAAVTTRVLNVHPLSGNDRTGNGSDRTPFKTLTRALQVAQPGTKILLAEGTYTEETGETFPIRLKPGVIVEGDVQTRGQEVVLKGGGWFLSATSARQNVAIVGATQATLTGITVTNPHSEGYGVWVESSSPTIVDNTFTGNGHDGMSIVGNSAPIVRSNFFYQNGANGLTVYGTSRPHIQENIFEQTGFAININQNAAPKIVGNRITQNKDGIVVQASAKPVLRNNSVEGNERNGLVAIAQSQPDLGTAAEPGGNIFRNNGQADVHVQASRQTIPAFGNEIIKSVGKLDLAGATPIAAPVVATQPAPSKPAASPKNSPPPSQPAASQAVQSPQPVNQAVKITPRNPASPSVTVTPTAKAPAPNPLLLTAASFPTPTTEPTPGRSPIPAPLSSAVPPPRITPVPESALPSGSDQSQEPMATVEDAPRPLPVRPAPMTMLPPIPAQPMAIQIPVPPPESSSGTPGRQQTPPAPALEAMSDMGDRTELLPVPGPDVPVGNIGESTQVPVYRRVSMASQSVRSANQATNRYRVVVTEDVDASQQAQVRALVPGAVVVAIDGRNVMQLGVFEDRERANELIQTLANQGIRAALEFVSPN